MVRTTIEAMAAVFGGTQSLHTNALDEAIALPTEFSAALRATRSSSSRKNPHHQRDRPLGWQLHDGEADGDMADAAWKIIEEVEAMGGMTQAVDIGWAKLKIEAAAAEKQARIDSGKDVMSASTSTSWPRKTRSISSKSTT